MNQKCFSRTDGILLAVWGAYFVVLMPRMMWAAPDGLYVGHEYLWSDWASLHSGMTRIFAFKSPKNWFAYHPVFAEGKFTYPFLVNLLSGMLVRCGLPFSAAMVLPPLFSFLAIILGMKRFFTLLLGKESLAALAIALFFCSAGWAFTKELATLWESGWNAAFPVSTLLSAVPSHQWGANNLVIAMLLPQRAFTLGLAISIWSLYGFWSRASLSALSPRDRTVVALSGFGVGLLPIVHAHSLIAVAILCAPLCIFLFLKKRPAAAIFAGVASATAIAFYAVFVAGGIKSDHFMRFFPGYTATGLWDWIRFWLWVWGLALPLAAWGLARQLREKRTLLFWAACGGFSIFAAANLFLFQPTAWDNAKLFLWAYLLLVPAAVAALRSIYGRSRPLAAALFTFCALTGALELVDLQCVSRHSFRLLSAEEMRFAEEISAHTNELDRFAAATAHAHLIPTWAARPTLVGYLGWVGNYGFQYEQAYADLHEIFRGGAGSEEALKDHGIRFVFVGPQEKAEFPDLNEAFFKEKYPLAFSSPALGAAVYRIK